MYLKAFWKLVAQALALNAYTAPTWVQLNHFFQAQPTVVMGSWIQNLKCSSLTVSRSWWKATFWSPRRRANWLCPTGMSCKKRKRHRKIPRVSFSPCLNCYSTWIFLSFLLRTSAKMLYQMARIESSSCWVAKTSNVARYVEPLFFADGRWLWFEVMYCDAHGSGSECLRQGLSGVKPKRSVCTTRVASRNKLAVNGKWWSIMISFYHSM